MTLTDYTTAELQAELRRRFGRSPVPRPTWLCERCGAIGTFDGPWKPWLYEIHFRAFLDAHRHCPPFYGGGGI